MEPFRDALNRLIDERGLMQLELAAEANVSESAISLYRSGKRNAKPATIAKIAKALGLDVGEAWDAAPEGARRELLRQVFSRIQADREGLTFTVIGLPASLRVPYVCGSMVAGAGFEQTAYMLVPCV